MQERKQEITKGGVLKRGSSVVSALLSSGSIPGVGKEFSVSEHAFLRVICRYDMKTMRRPSDRDVNWRQPLRGKVIPCEG